MPSRLSECAGWYFWVYVLVYLLRRESSTHGWVGGLSTHWVGVGQPGRGGGVTYPPPPLRKHQESQKNDGQTGSRCLEKAVLARDVRRQLSQEQRHESWLKITSKQTKVGRSSKHNVVISRRTHPKHDTAPVSLYNRHTVTFC